MKRKTESNNEIDYHHIRSVIVLVVFTVLMAALACLFAYLFDQISWNWSQIMNHAYSYQPREVADSGQ